MNYKLINTHFTKIQERSGLIENNSTGNIEIVITSGDENPREVQPTTICQNGKMIYKLNKNQTIWGISISRIYSMINVLPLAMEQLEGNMEVDGKSIDLTSEGKVEIFDFSSITKDNMGIRTKFLKDGSIGLEWYDTSKAIEDIIIEVESKVDKSDIMTLAQAQNIIEKYKENI